MTDFVLLATAIVVVCLIPLLYPLLREDKRDKKNGLTHDAQNLHFARQRLLELEQQHASQLISQSDYAALKSELESSLAMDIDLGAQVKPLETAPADKRTANWLLTALLCVAIPALSGLIYQSVGTPQALDLSSKTTATEKDIEKIISDIEMRLTEHPDDVQGWQILTRTYQSLARFKDARRVLLKLLELQGESADVLVGLADTHSALADGQMRGQAEQYAQRALELAPQHPQALWLVGLAAAQQNKLDVALEYWNRLLPLLQDTPAQQELRQIILQAKEQVSASVAPAPNQLTILVSASDSALANAQADDPVFVLARADASAPPLAVKRLQVRDLPAQVQLSDADAMLAEFKLSLFAEVSVTARIAKSGNPIAQTGDIQSAVVVTKNTNQQAIELVINQIIE